MKKKINLFPSRFFQKYYSNKKKLGYKNRQKFWRSYLLQIKWGTPPKLYLFSCIHSTYYGHKSFWLIVSLFKEIISVYGLSPWLNFARIWCLFRPINYIESFFSKQYRKHNILILRWQLYSMSAHHNFFLYKDDDKNDQDNGVLSFWVDWN